MESSWQSEKGDPSSDEEEVKGEKRMVKSPRTTQDSIKWLKISNSGGISPKTKEDLFCIVCGNYVTTQWRTKLTEGFMGYHRKVCPE